MGMTWPMEGKKTQNMNIWLLGRTLLGVAFFGFSNSVS